MFCRAANPKIAKKTLSEDEKRVSHVQTIVQSDVVKKVALRNRTEELNLETKGQKNVRSLDSIVTVGGLISTRRQFFEIDIG